MSIKVNQRSYEYAQRLITSHHCVFDRGDDWTDHRPSRQAERTVIKNKGIAEFRRWHLGEDEEQEETGMSRYKFPMAISPTCVVQFSLPKQADKYKYADIELAAATLRGMLDALIKAPVTRSTR